MAFPENGYVPPRVADVRSSANKTATLAILVIVVLLIGLPAVFGTTAVLPAKKTSGAAIGVGNEFLGDIDSENYSAAHDLFVPELQSSIPTKSISGIFGGLTAAHGNLETWNKPQWFVQTYNGVTYVRLTYSVCLRSRDEHRDVDHAKDVCRSLPHPELQYFSLTRTPGDGRCSRFFVDHIDSIGQFLGRPLCVWPLEHGAVVAAFMAAA